MEQIRENTPPPNEPQPIVPTKPAASVSRKEIIQSVLVGLLSIGVCVALVVLPIPYLQLGDFGYLGVFLFSAIASAGMVLPAPSMAGLFVGVTFLNPALVALAYGTGSAIGELTGYGLGFSGRAALENNRAYERVVGWMNRYGIWSLLVLAIIPNPLFDVAGLAAGALRIPLWKFLLVISLGRIIRGLLIILVLPPLFMSLGWQLPQ